MKILLAPSETKSAGGDGNFAINDLDFKELNSAREPMITEYDSIIKSATLQELTNIFGIKKESDILKQKDEYLNGLKKKAILRYTGVAFDYLDYESLENSEKDYIDSNLYIFSNLYGVVKANNLIPNYKLKQGVSIGSIKPEKVYKDSLKDILDSALKDEEILDIRAGYYNKFYKPSAYYTTVKFLKDGKVVSHWAKAYRGLVLRYCAINKITNIKDFLAMEVPNLSIKEIVESKNSQEIVYEVQI